MDLYDDQFRLARAIRGRGDLVLLSRFFQAAQRRHSVTDPDHRNDDDAMRARLAALSRDLKGNARPEDEKPSATEQSASGVSQAISLGMRVMSEFVAAVVVGGFIGWQLDRWLGSSPVALIIFIGVGTAAGFWSVYRVATKAGSK